MRAATDEKEVLDSSRHWLGQPAQGADARPIGHVPVLGEGLDPRAAGQRPGLVHRLRHLVGGGVTGGENWVSGGQGHKLRDEVPQRLVSQEHCFATKFALPEVDNCRLDKFLKDELGGGIIEESYWVGEKIFEGYSLEFKKPGL